MDSEGLQGHCLATRSSITDFLLKSRCQDESVSRYLLKLPSIVGCQFITLKSFQEAFGTFHCSISAVTGCQSDLHSARQFCKKNKKKPDRSIVAAPSSQSNWAAQKPAFTFQRIFSCWVGGHVGACFSSARGNQWKVTPSPEESAATVHLTTFILLLTVPPTSCWPSGRKQEGVASVCSKTGLEEEKERERARETSEWLVGLARHTLGRGGGVIGK